MSTSTDILILADQELVRHGLRCLVGGWEGYEVCASGALEDPIPAAARPPEVLLLVAARTDARTVDRLQALRGAFPAAPFILILTDPAACELKPMIHHGVRGFLSEREALDHLSEALVQVQDGQFYVGADLMPQLVFSIVTDDETSDRVAQLSDREREVLRLTGQGYRPRAIAEVLRLSPKTVHAHRENLKKKLEMGSMAELDQAAAEWVLGDAQKGNTHTASAGGALRAG